MAEIRIPTGPVRTEPLGAISRADDEHWTEACRTALCAELGGLELGAYDETLLHWIAEWGPSVTATVCSWLRRRADQAGGGDVATGTVLALSRPVLEALVPAGSSFEQAWIVCIAADREQTSVHEGRPYQAITRWHPVLPAADRFQAVRAGERMGAAFVGEPDEWWYMFPADGAIGIAELWGVAAGGDVRPGIAIVPLAALLELEAAKS